MSGSGNALLAPQSNGRQPLVVNNWGPPPATAAQATASGPMNRSSELGREGRQGLAVAICTVLLSIPALIGSWCWPLVLAGLFAGLSKQLDTAGAKSFTHAITWGINLAIFTNMLQFVARRTACRAQYGYWRKWGPFWCIFVGMIGMLTDLTRHLLNDAFDIMPMDNPDGSLSVYGWTMTIFGTWVGAFLLLTGILWDTKLLQKVHGAWRSARGQ